MKKILCLVLLLVFLAALILGGCARAGSALNGSGKIVDKVIKTKEFNTISVKGAFTIDIQQADSCSVVLSTDENLIGRIRISVERKTLKLSIEAPATFFPTKLKLAISMPSLIGLNLSGGAKSTINSFKLSDPFSLFLAEKSSLTGTLQAGSSSFHLSGASTVHLAGSGDELDLTSLEGAKANLGEFPLLRANIKLDQASEAIINVKGRFDVDLNGESKVYFLGDPIFTNTSISGGSTMSMIQK